MSAGSAAGRTVEAVAGRPLGGGGLCSLARLRQILVQPLRCLALIPRHQVPAAMMLLMLASAANGLWAVPLYAASLATWLKVPPLWR